MAARLRIVVLAVLTLAGVGIALAQGINPITPPANWVFQIVPPSQTNPSNFYTTLSENFAGGLTYANRPSAVNGSIFYMTDGLAGSCGDSACTTFGTTVTGGGGALKILVWYNGANWTLMGK